MCVRRFGGCLSLCLQIERVSALWEAFQLVLGYGVDDWGFESRQELGNFLFATAS